MRKLNGITINGEYLGNSVVINGMFRAICTISPVIMRDFVQIINKIERLDEAVKINNFNCGFDSIDIEFRNSNAKGIASLYFKLINGEPELTDCRLIIDDKEYSTLSETIIAPEICSPKTNETQNGEKQLTEEEIARRQKISELKAKKLEKMRQEKEQHLNNKPVNRPPAANLSNKSQFEQKTDNAPPKSKLEKLLEQKKRIAEAKAGKNAASISTSPVGQNVTESQAEKFANNNSNQSNALENNYGNTSNNTDLNSTNNETSNETNNLNTLNENTTNSSKSLEKDNNELKNQNSDYTEQSTQNDTYEESDFDTYNETKTSKFENLEDIDLDNLSEEELAELEAELEAEMEAEQEFNDTYPSDTVDDYSYSGNQGFDGNFAQTLSQGLIEGLTQGLSQGLAQGLAQGLSEGLGQLQNNSWGGGGNNQNFGGGFNDGFDSGFNNSSPSAGFNFDDGQQSMNNNFASGAQSPQYQPIVPDYGKIDNINADAAMAAKDYYDYDENSNLDDLSDLYSDFYEENKMPDEIEAVKQTAQAENGPNTSEVDALKAELEALRAETETKKDLMTLDEFLAKQKELENAKEKKRRQKLRIVGSRERVNASALDGGVFVAGNKVYKWGDTKVLND